MQKYVTCPSCGTKLGRAEEIKNLEYPCPKCRELLTVNVTNKAVEVILSKNQTNENKPQQTVVC